MNNETRGIAGTVELVAERGREVRARAANIVDAAAERGRRVYDSAVDEAAGVMSSASEKVEAVGEKAHSAGDGIRRRTKRAARAISRGEKNLRASDPQDFVDAAAGSLQRHRVAFAVAGAAILAFFTVKFLRRGT